MKILFVDNSLRSLINFRGEVIEHFVARGDEVVIVYPKIKQEVCNTIFESHDIKHVSYNCNPSGKNVIKDLRLILFFIKLYHEERPDIIFHYTIKPNIYGSIAAFITKCRSVSMVPGLGYMFSKNGFIGKIGRLLYKFALRLNYKVIVLNEDNYNLFLKNHYVKRNRLVLFSHGEGVNLDKFRYTKKEFNSTHFLMVARVLYDKGYSEYVEAAKLVKKLYPDTVFYLVGDIDESSPSGVRASVIRSDNNTKESITYLGWTPDILTLLCQDGAVVVLPSKYREGLNRSLMEACAVGCPIITTDIPGCREMVKQNINGYLVKPENIVDLADAMVRFIKLPVEKKQIMSVNSNALAQEFDINNVISKYDDIVAGKSLEIV